MAKRLNYEIGFTADTSNLNAALQKIQSDLSKISLGKISTTAVTSEINEAADAAGRLNLALKNAINADTGRLDLSKFAGQLKTSGLTLDQYRQKLSLIGTSGTEAFINVAKAVTQAELPIARSSKLLDSLWVTMKNTARWQLTSSALHGFMGGLQACYGYAQDLNSSLSNIRIVTGQNTEQMAEFAKQANKAAKALSSTTTNYTDAALIYYQQGLDDKAVKERTDATIKMANVTATSAQEVSDQMTAIWNNFDNGTKSLEYYADVITALGAATASSSAEISDGLEKFAAIASTVGLSYEYATSALATVTATTRQSADIVGTAFKTLFARIQGLNLGETLDDGTDLNKYSKALMDVGINIKDQNGQLKEMDTILNEMAAKWDTLNKDQQLALAQTVAGVRQYTQLVALMDNWDFMEENLATARDSVGTLQEQADIYAESWEAARNRVRAAAEDVYSSLIDEDFFIDLDNSISDVLGLLDDAIDTMGGFKGVLVTVGTLMTSVYGDKMAQSIRNIGYNLSYTMGIEQARAVQLKEQMIQQFRTVASDNMASPEWGDVGEVYARQAQMQIDINKAANQLTDYQRQQIEQETELVNLATQRAAEYGTVAAKAREQMEIFRESALIETEYLKGRVKNNIQRYNDNKANDQRWSGEIIHSALQGTEIKGIYDFDDNKIGQLTVKFQDLGQKIGQVSTISQELAKNSTPELKAKLNDLIGPSGNASEAINQMRQQMRDIIFVFTEFIGTTPEGTDALRHLRAEALKAGINLEKFGISAKHQEEAIGVLNTKLQQFKNSTGDYANKIVGLANAAGQFAMAINAVKSIGRVFSDEDMDAGERFSTILMSLSMLIPLVSTAMKALTNAEKENTVANIIATAAMKAKVGETVLSTTALGENATTKAAAAVANKILGTSEKALASDMRKVIAILAAKMIMLLPYAAALGAVAVAIYALVKAYNADADAAKRAKKAAEDTAKAMQEAKTAADQLRSSINAYDSAVDKLNECTKGTEEWRDALKEVNEAAIEVLNNAGKLSADDIANFRNEDGSINRDAIAKLQEDADRRANNLSYASALADRRVANAQLTADATELARQIYSERDEQAMQDAKTTYNINRSNSPMTSAQAKQLAEAMARQQSGQYGETGDKNILLNNYERLAKLSIPELNKELDELGFVVSESTEIWHNSISQMSDDVEAASEKFNLITQMKVEEALGIPEADDLFGKAVNAVTTKNLDALSQKLADTWEKKLTSDLAIWDDSNSEVYQEALEALQKAGYDVARQTDNAVRGTADNRSLAFLNSQGDEVVYNSEQIASMIAAAQALDQIGESANAARKALSGLGENELNYLAQGDFSNTKRSELGTYQSDNDEEIISAFGGIEAVKAIIASQRGIEIEATEEFIAEFLDGVRKSAGLADEAIIEAAKSSLPTIQKSYQMILQAQGNMSAEQAATLVGTMNQIFREQGPEALSGFTQMLSGLGADVSKFLDGIEGIDWAHITPEALRQELNNMGFDAKRISDETLPELISWMRQARDVSLEVAQAQYKAIKEISDAIKNNTSTITQEQIDALAENGLAIDAYFTKMADGTYGLIEDADTLRSIINSIAMKDLYDASDTAVARYNELQGLQDKIKEPSSLSPFEKINLTASSGVISAAEAIELEARLNDAQTRYSTAQAHIDMGQSVNIGEMGLASQAYREAAAEVDEKFNAAAISTEKIKEMLGEAALEAQQAQEAISNAQFQNDVESFGLDLDETTRYAKRLESQLNVAEDAARDFAIANQRLDRGLSNVNDNLEDYKKALIGTDKSTADYSKTMDVFKQDLADIFNLTDSDLLDDTFAEGILASDDFARALDGDIEAYNRLRMEVSNQIVGNIKIGMEEEGPKEGESKEDFETRLANYTSAWEQAKTLLTEGIKTGTIEDTSFIDSLNEMITAAGMSYDQITSMLGSMGVSAKIHTEYEPQPITVPTYHEYSQSQIVSPAEYDETTGTLTKPATWERKTWTVQGEPFETEGYVPVYSLETTSGDTTSGGGIEVNNNPPVSTGTTTSGRTGGGGGGSRSTPKKKSLTRRNDIQERYHEINDQIDDVTRATKKLNIETDRLYGAKKFANMDKEISKLREQASLIEEKTRQAKAYLGTLNSGDMGALVDAAAGVGFTLDASNFDAEGNLLNVEEIQRSMWDKLHEMEVAYNAKATSDQQEKYEEEVIQPWQDKIDEFERALELYEETRELAQDLAEERMEILREIEDIRFNKIVEEIEIRLDYKDAKKDINELAKVIREAVGTAYDWGKDVAGIDFDNMEIEKSKMAEYQDEYSQLMALLEESRTNPAIDQAAIKEQFEELRGQIIGSAEALVEWAESLEDVLPDAIDAAREHFDQFINQLEHNTSIIDTIKEIMVLQGLTFKAAQGFNDIQDIHQKRMDATLAQAKLNRQWYERAAEQLQQAQAALDAAPRDTQQYDILKSNRDALLQEYNEAQEAMLNSAKETMDEARDMYIDAVERTAYELEQILTKGDGFDLLQDKYDHYLDTEERYLDTVNRIYETTTLNNKLQKELDKTTNVVGAAKLKALQEEFQLRQANNKLSQYDIDIMNAKLELTLKQMALEEAQNAKTDLRLVRNAQGNWNYQYTANQDDVNAANQEYLDAMNEYYNLAKDKVTEVTGEIIDTWQEMTEKIKEIYENEELTVEEREAQIAEIREYYSQKVKDLEEEKQKAIVDMTEAGQIAIDDFKDKHHDVLEEMGGDVNNLKDIFSDDLAAILAGADDFNNEFATDMDNLSEEVANFDEIFENTLNKMDEAVQHYQEVTTNVNTEVGISYDDLKEMLNEVSGSTEELTERGFEEIDMMWDKLNALQAVTEQYSMMADSILQAAEAMRQLASATMQAQFGETDSSLGFDKDTDYTAVMSSYLQNGGSTSDAIYAELMRQREEKINWLQTDAGGNKTQDYWLNRGQATTDMFNQLVSGGGNQVWYNTAAGVYQDTWDEILKRLTGFATGGYTGEFENGKLAVLHEKELVLNEQDTANILAAVNTVRDLDSIWLGAAKNLDSIVAQSLGMMMGRLSSTMIPNKDNQILEQKITIEHVEFPNANDKNEILEALHSLPDMASQWARIKKD